MMNDLPPARDDSNDTEAYASVTTLYHMNALQSHGQREKVGGSLTPCDHIRGQSFIIVTDMLSRLGPPAPFASAEWMSGNRS